MKEHDPFLKELTDAGWTIVPYDHRQPPPFPNVRRAVYELVCTGCGLHQGATLVGPHTGTLEDANAITGGPGECVACGSPREHREMREVQP